MSQGKERVLHRPVRRSFGGGGSHAQGRHVRSLPVKLNLRFEPRGRLTGCRCFYIVRTLNIRISAFSETHRKIAFRESASKNISLQDESIGIDRLMLNSGDLAYLKRALLSNTAILFTGAGFSRDATNHSGKPLPTGEQFADQLWTYLGYPGTRGKETLPRLFEAALRQPHAPLKELLRQNFECRSVAGWYSIPASLYWYRIYSLNIDNVLETAFRQTHLIQLQVINGQKHDYSDRDQFLNSIQYVKLNGTDWSNPKEITFSFTQYARRAIESPVWYEQCARDFARRVVLFMGTELEEQLLWNAVELRGKRFPGGESRPKSFFIKPHISPVDAENLKEYNVVPVEATAKDFFEYLSTHLADETNREKVMVAAQPGFARLCAEIKENFNDKSAKDLQSFYTLFEPVVIPDKTPSARKSFLLGAAPDWPSLHAHLDAERDCTNELVKQIEGLLEEKAKVQILSITGAAGSGKSTMARRAALTLRARGYLVFWSNADSLIPDHALLNSLSLLPARPIIFVDNANSIRTALAQYIKLSAGTKAVPVFVISDRANRSEFFEKQLAKDYVVSFFRMPLLSAPDIDRLLDKLQEYGLLGKLQAMSRDRQIREFSVRAGKQILVAMREATLGADFDTIIANELNDLQAEEIKIVYLAACLATAAGYGLTTEQIVGLTDLSPAECLALLDGGLKGVVVELGGKTGLWFARHRIIAEVVVDKLAARDLLKQAYKRLLEALSRDLPRPIKTASRVFRLYRDVINHTLISKRFRNSILDAREIYEAVRPYCEHDQHFWLQYASLELEYGELNYAEIYISSAEALAPYDNFVQNTKASLLYQKAIATDRVQEALGLREEARSILLRLTKKTPGDYYPPHILCSHELTFIRTWYLKRDELRKHMSILRDDVDSYVKSHQYSERLSDLQRQIHEAYLDLAIKEF